MPSQLRSELQANREPVSIDYHPGERIVLEILAPSCGVSELTTNASTQLQGNLSRCRFYPSLMSTVVKL